MIQYLTKYNEYTLTRSKWPAAWRAAASSTSGAGRAAGGHAGRAGGPINAGRDGALTFSFIVMS